MHDDFAWSATSLTCALFLVPVAVGCVVDLKGCIMVILTSLSCACVGFGYHACQHDPWCNLNYVDHKSAVGYLDVYTTRLLFISVFMRVCQAFDMCARDVGLCGYNVIIKNLAWSALNALILMTTMTTDELPGEMDYHVFVALSLTIVSVLAVAPHAANRTRTWMVGGTFGSFLIGTLLFFEAERLPSEYQLLHSLWHASFSATALASIFAIRARPIVSRPAPPTKTAGSIITG